MRPDSASLQRARALIDAQYVQPLDLAQLSSTANFSRYHFIRLFCQEFDQTPHQYLMRRRIDKAKELLAENKLTITEVCFAVGFESLGSFSALFRRMVGQSPKAYRARLLEQHHHPQKFIPACYLIMNGISAA